jgi:FtsP/CotA-like multicopper oxidase with cupredoxin domain
MLEEMIVHQAGEPDRSESSSVKQSEVTRRDFLQRAMAVASGLALYSMLPPFARKTWAQQPVPCPAGQPLQSIMEITSSGATRVLQAVIKILDEEKTFWAPPLDGAAGMCAANTGQMRYIAGYDATNPSKVWPTAKGVPNPGPTLRARVGDKVQITLLNHVDVKKFPKTLDVAERGMSACDENKSVAPDGTAINTYPGDPSFEKPPNCFHGSSSTNLHFHGSHVSPSGIADNVLLNIRPSPRGPDGKPLVNEQTVKAVFDQIFAACGYGHQPLLWTDWPLAWQTWQKKLLIAYDKTAVWEGKAGNLPVDQQLWPQNVKEMAEHRLPQYYIGAFPNCFKIPEWNGQKKSMGQAPGTHWYHGHKHGSTALNLANGMAGALIIEGDYDDKLKPFITKQRVLVLQQIGAVLPLLRSAAGQKPFNADFVHVNGQYTPVIQLNPNEMQLWRIVNACHQAAVPLDEPKGIKWVQTAQDGVQFNPANYDPSDTNASFPVPARSKAPFGSLAPGNRIDLLVQAPSSPGPYKVTFGGKLLCTVNVAQDPAVRPIVKPMPFPTRDQFPRMPGFLEDISFGDVTVKRDLHFKSVADPTIAPAMGRGKNAPFPPPVHTINGEQFEMGRIDQTMQLGATEEWTLYNDGGAAHPFHIHINPFQVVELMDPKQNNGNPVRLPRPWVWWDNFAIPKGGYVKMLTKFVDFTGMYVLHCHILGHEDRGMMQLVQVVTNTTNMQHK